MVSQLFLFLSYDGFSEIKREFPFHLHNFLRNLHFSHSLLSTFGRRMGRDTPEGDKNVVQGLLIGESMVRTDIIILEVRIMAHY